MAPSITPAQLGFRIDWQQWSQIDWSAFGLWLGVIGAVLVVSGVALMVVRRRWQQRKIDAGRAPFTLHDLRRLHREGALSDEEFARAKRRIAALATADLGQGEADASEAPPSADDVEQKTSKEDEQRGDAGDGEAGDDDRPDG